MNQDLKTTLRTFCANDVTKDAEYCFFDCPQFETERDDLSNKEGKPLKVNNLVDNMLESKENWASLCNTVNEIITNLRCEEHPSKFSQKGNRPFPIQQCLTVVSRSKGNGVGMGFQYEEPQGKFPISAFNTLRDFYKKKNIKTKKKNKKIIIITKNTYKVQAVCNICR